MIGSYARQKICKKQLHEKYKYGHTMNDGIKNQGIKILLKSVNLFWD